MMCCSLSLQDKGDSAKPGSGGSKSPQCDPLLFAPSWTRLVAAGCLPTSGKSFPRWDLGILRLDGALGTARAPLPFFCVQN